MDRRQIILGPLRKSGRGLEIGPSCNPIAPKSEGFNVDILDHVDQETLIKRYLNALQSQESGFVSTIAKTDVNFDTDAIEEVDYIWNGEPIDEIIGKTKYYDWVIASHVIEHVPDLIEFLNGISTVLKDDGIVSLALPDKRFCFDYFRPLSGLGQVIDSHVRRLKVHSPGQIAEHYLYAATKAGKPGWNHFYQGNLELQHDSFAAKKVMDRIIETGEYHDVHAWCFTPSSFRLIMHDLFLLKMVELKELSFRAGKGHEFYIALSKNGSGHPGSRRHLLDVVNDEIKFTGYNKYYCTVRKWMMKMTRFF